ncbi:MAG: hypothetical protein AB1750_15420, partial [Chloroflexota bacterium]
ANVQEDYSGADTREALWVFNNTFYGNPIGISGGDNLVAFNNIIANSSARGVWRVQGSPGDASVVAYSLFFNNGADAEQSALGAGLISGQDPLFVAAPNPGSDGTWATVDDDFSGLLLSSASPAIDRGIVQFSAANGELIPIVPLSGWIGPAPDLGWREFGSPVFPPPAPLPLATFTFAPPTEFPTLTSVPPSPTSEATSTPASGTETPLPPSATITPLPVTETPGTLTPTPGSQITPTPLVTLPPVEILEITPDHAQAEATILVTISGSGFQAGATVSFEGGVGTPPQVLNVIAIAPNTIVARVSLQVDAALGTQVWGVRVTNPDGSTAFLPNAFTVVVP